MGRRYKVKRVPGYYVQRDRRIMAKFGITPKRTFGVSIPNFRKIAKGLGINHELAIELWQTSLRETKILASMIDDPRSVTEEQIENWVKEFDY